MDSAPEQPLHAQPTQPPPVPPGPPSPPKGGRNPALAIVGLALFAPALIALIISYIAPTVWTMATSFQDVNPTRPENAEMVGLDNYEAISEQLPSTLGYALGLGALPLLTFLIAAPLLAFAAHMSGLAGRWVVRIAFAVPMVFIAPTALAASFRLDQIGEDSPLVNVTGAQMALLGAIWVGTFGLVLGLGITLFLATLRRRDDQGSVWPGLMAVAGLGVLAVPALALQIFTYPLVVTGGGPASATMTPMLELYNFGFRMLRYGSGAAEATILLLVLGVLGLLAWLLVYLSGLRMELDPMRKSADDTSEWNVGRIVAVLLGAVGLIIVLVITWNGLSPALSRIISRTGGEEVAIASTSSLLVNTWLPPLISAVVAVGLAALGGFAIGALRPLGCYSELLLLPFAPWLFVGIGPLAIAKWDAARDAELINTFVGLIPPVWVAIPALFVFTLLFKGQERRRQEMLSAGVASGDASVRAYLPALPMVVLLLGFSWLIHAQDLLWPLLTASDPDQSTGPVMLLRIMGSLATGDVPIFLALPLAVVLIAGAVMAVGQVLYLDRLAIRAGRR